MKLAKLILATWLVSLASLFGQANGVQVEVTLDQEQYLPDEEVLVAVKITNRSGQTLELGKEDDWLTFSIESRENMPVAQIDIPPVAGEFSLGSSLSGTKRVNLTPYFKFSRPSSYRVTANVKIPQWSKQVSSNAKSFEVIAGTRLQEIEFGVPLEGNKTGSPEMRRYILQQAIYQKHMRLYVRITDVTGANTFKLFSLATMTSFTRPEAQLDQFSNLHVLSQSGAKSFAYAVINPDGQMLTRQTYDYSDTRPVLKFNPEGRVRVFGGARRITAADLPAPQNADSISQTNANAEK
jgi:hypothetical protein